MFQTAQGQKLNGLNGESEWGRIPIRPVQIHHSPFSFNPVQDPRSDHSVLAPCRLEIKQRNAVQVQDLFKYYLNIPLTPPPPPHNVVNLHGANGDPAWGASPIQIPRSDRSVLAPVQVGNKTKKCSSSPRFI